MKKLKIILTYSVIIFILSTRIYGSEKRKVVVSNYDSLGMQLLSSVEHGKTERIKNALAKGADINYQHPETGDTAFHYVARYHQFLLMPLLNIKGAKICVLNKDGISPGEELLNQPTRTQYQLNWEQFETINTTNSNQLSQAIENITNNTD